MEIIHEELLHIQKLQRALQLALDSLARIEQMGSVTNLDLEPEGFEAKQTRELILKGNF